MKYNILIKEKIIIDPSKRKYGKDFKKRIIELYINDKMTFAAFKKNISFIKLPYQIM